MCCRYIEGIRITYSHMYRIRNVTDLVLRAIEASGDLEDLGDVQYTDMTKKEWMTDEQGS